MKELDDFIQDVMDEQSLKTLGSVTHGVAKDAIMEAAERYAKDKLSNGLTSIIKAISDTQYQATNELGDKADEWVTDIDTINNIDFKTLLGL